MSSVKSSSSIGDPNGKDPANHVEGKILKMGYIKKLKTMKKKFFIIRGDSTDSSASTARIEYYDSEKKWRTHHLPKRCILLKSCFNINRRVDTKHKNVIALYTKDDCFCLVFDSEDEMNDWLKALLSLQQGEDVVDGESPKPTFEHVWQVTVAKRGLGSHRNILGPHLLCLTDKTLSLVKINQNEKTETYEFSLMNIRRCGDMESFFYMEVGRSSCTGAGDLWMQTEDTNIAQNMHAAILHAMSNNSAKEELGPRPTRPRSSSANEASKPISVLQRRQTHAGLKPGTTYFPTGLSATGGLVTEEAKSTGGTYSDHPVTPHPASQHTQGTVTNNGRERCDSMPSRARTTSEGHHAPQHIVRNVHLVPGHNRPHSMYNRGISYSPPVGSNPVSPASGACSTDSAGSSLSVDDEHNWIENETGLFGVGRYGHSLTPDEPIIFEENMEVDDSTVCSTEEKLNNYMPMDRGTASLSLPIQTAMKATMPIKFSPNLGSSGFKSGSPSASYMEMCSPCGSSPLDTVGAYMPMSPGLDVLTRYGRSASSASHSRASSLAEDGYVPMAPGQTDDGYVDMDPAHPEHFVHGEISPGNSSCSIASGTPSADLRFSEYPLEKVSSYFTPSEEDEGSDRPARAYSVGSRPSSTPKTRPELTNLAETVRQRAFSVGSRAAKPPGGSRPSSRHVLAATPPSGKKSSSAPLLSHSWSGSPTLRPPLYASGEPMDDLMEMDFSKNSRKAAKNRSNARTSRAEALPPQHVTADDVRLAVPLNNLSISPSNLSVSPSSRVDCSGYMEMTPAKAAEVRPISNPITVSSVTSGPYLEMRPGNGGDYLSRSHSISPPQMNHLSRGSILSGSPKTAASPPPSRLLAMSRKASVLGVAPFIDSAGHAQPEPTLVRNADAYMDMRGPQPQHFPSTTLAAHVTAHAQRADSFPLARKPTSPIQEEYMEMNMKHGGQEVSPANRSAPVDTPQPRVVPDPKAAYVDMSWGSASNKPVLSAGQGEEDYMNVMAGDGRRRKERRNSRKDKQRFSSQPITIQAANSKETKPGSSASTSPVLSMAILMANRKTSTGTPPKLPPGFLPIGSASSSMSPGSSPYNSLRRSRNRKAARRGSSEVNLATPTGSTTGIFPFSLNSPGSPMKPLPGAKCSDSGFEYDRKCPVDASSGTVCLSYPYPDGSSGSNPVTPDSSSSSEQPTPVNPESATAIASKAEDNNDYVNYSPARRPNQDVSKGGDEFGEYAIMRPGATNVTGRRISTPMFGGISKVDSLPKKVSVGTTSTTTLVSSKPVSIAAAVVDTPPLKQPTTMSLLSFRPISGNPTATEGSSSPKIISSFGSTNKGSSFFNRQHSSTSVSSMESVKSQETSAKETKAGALVSRQLSNSSVKSACASGECGPRDDGAYESLCNSGGVSPVPTSRPGSVTCERELHYASLDLVTEPDDGTRSPRNFKSQSSMNESTPSPNPGQAETFTYAEIDFVKSESLKNSCPPAPVNTKVCH